MANILDYLSWRGDLPFEKIPFCDVDYLVLCRMAYIPFDGVAPGDFEGRVTIAEAARRVLDLVAAPDSTREFRIEDDEALLLLLIDSDRFANIPIAGFINVFDVTNEEQFSAVTAFLPDGSAAVAFRGTDGTLVGWKEDFNMSLSGAVPAQLDAARYVERLGAQFDGPIRTGGHSKGGNLAVYSAAYCAADIQQRIIEVRNYDGPGFDEEAVKGESFMRIMPRTRTFLPQSSVIGMLLEHAEDFSIVESVSRGIFQHNVYTWEVARGGFFTVKNRTNSSQFIDATLKEWVRRMSPELREKMINGVYAALCASEGTMLRDLWTGKHTVAIIRAVGDMDDETRETLKTAMRMLKASMTSAMPALLEGLKAPKSSGGAMAERRRSTGARRISVGGGKRGGTAFGALGEAAAKKTGAKKRTKRDLK